MPRFVSIYGRKMQANPLRVKRVWDWYFDGMGAVIDLERGVVRRPGDTRSIRCRHHIGKTVLGKYKTLRTHRNGKRR